MKALEKCLTCDRRFLWIKELNAYVPLTIANCNHDDCLYGDRFDDLEIDEEINYDPENYQL
ncbi:MAG: hypothetical protein IM504_19680 [Microcystis sp. M038S2]|jgi:hypothetical protein|uniref:hypothetical protein n=1 Tax=unclassified Microcystis TaxID=2643300 RepID=UPI00118FF3A9|nr:MULTISPECIES: hypothetical protein [unclassified Microcystis]TRU59547.1 MAG: hypothetical protein EWV48_14615 [Microcystis aeruginosa Ma_QC_C_20070823_S13]TRU62244.1 MAG: hypothetical protein EWV56_07555 [Microcystis aeruginosa Ma_QC_C_20070823_S13D]MCA2685407.1 hypothetical protein [Microcystis sp. M046S2]MCA2706961.1 hypothetical protein [Microcystis sp. M038S2]MCA2953720.1 hypothetical protein [Microcystis sp. M112S1]